MKRGAVYTIACLLAGLSAFSCVAARPGPVRTLSPVEVRALIDKGRPVVVDTRGEYEYRQGRLPGAVSIPPYRFKDLSTLLPSDKAREIVFYCRGSG